MQAGYAPIFYRRLFVRYGRRIYYPIVNTAFRGRSILVAASAAIDQIYRVPVAEFRPSGNGNFRIGLFSRDGRAWYISENTDDGEGRLDLTDVYNDGIEFRFERELIDSIDVFEAGISTNDVAKIVTAKEPNAVLLIQSSGMMRLGKNVKRRLTVSAGDAFYLGISERTSAPFTAQFGYRDDAGDVYYLDIASDNNQYHFDFTKDKPKQPVVFSGDFFEPRCDLGLKLIVDRHFVSVSRLLEVRDFSTDQESGEISTKAINCIHIGNPSDPARFLIENVDGSATRVRIRFLGLDVRDEYVYYLTRSHPAETSAPRLALRRFSRSAAATKSGATVFDLFDVRTQDASTFALRNVATGKYLPSHVGTGAEAASTTARRDVASFERFGWKFSEKGLTGSGGGLARIATNEHGHRTFACKADKNTDAISDDNRIALMGEHLVDVSRTYDIRNVPRITYVLSDEGESGILVKTAEDAGARGCWERDAKSPLPEVGVDRLWSYQDGTPFMLACKDRNGKIRVLTWDDTPGEKSYLESGKITLKEFDFTKEFISDHHNHFHYNNGMIFCGGYSSFLAASYDMLPLITRRFSFLTIYKAHYSDALRDDPRRRMLLSERWGLSKSGYLMRRNGPLGAVVAKRLSAPSKGSVDVVYWTEWANVDDKGENDDFDSAHWFTIPKFALESRLAMADSKALLDPPIKPSSRAFFYVTVGSYEVYDKISCGTSNLTYVDASTVLDSHNSFATREVSVLTPDITFVQQSSDAKWARYHLVSFVDGKMQPNSYRHIDAPPHCSELYDFLAQDRIAYITGDTHIPRSLLAEGRENGNTLKFMQTSENDYGHRLDTVKFRSKLIKLKRRSVEHADTNIIFDNSEFFRPFYVTIDKEKGSNLFHFESRKKYEDVTSSEIRMALYSMQCGVYGGDHTLFGISDGMLRHLSIAGIDASGLDWGAAKLETIPVPHVAPGNLCLSGAPGLAVMDHFRCAVSVATVDGKVFVGIFDLDQNKFVEWSLVVNIPLCRVNPQIALFGDFLQIIGITAYGGNLFSALIEVPPLNHD